MTNSILDDSLISETRKQSIFELSQEIDLCQKCSLALSRKRPLVGEGSLQAKIMIVGEAPGYYEDLEGKAFIGKAGKILDKLLLFAGLDRKELYITNILKCHPSQNRNPSIQEVEACSGYLYRQLNIIQPKIILTLGKHASKELFLKLSLPFSKISEMHGQIYEIKASYSFVKIIPLYHPSVAGYNAQLFNILKKDFEKISACLKKLLENQKKEYRNFKK